MTDALTVRLEIRSFRDLPVVAGSQVLGDLFKAGQIRFPQNLQEKEVRGTIQYV